MRIFRVFLFGLCFVITGCAGISGNSLTRDGGTLWDREREREGIEYQVRGMSTESTTDDGVPDIESDRDKCERDKRDRDKHDRNKCDRDRDKHDGNNRPK